MRIENNCLIIDEPLGDDKIEELVVALKQDEIEMIELQSDDISSGILQVLWCSKKKVEVEGFLSKFFDNVKVID